MTIKLPGGENHLYNNNLSQKDTKNGDIIPSNDKKIIDQCMAIHSFRRIDKHFYFDLQKEIFVDSYWDQNGSPKKRQRAYGMIHRNLPPITTTSHCRKHFRRNFNVIFTQPQISEYQGNSKGWKQVPETDGRINDNLCFNYNEYGHIAWYFISTSDTNNPKNETEH